MGGGIRVEVADAAEASHLIEGLTGIRARVVADGGRCQVEVRPDRESNRLLVGVLDAVETWLVRRNIRSTTVHLGGRTYELHSPTVPAA